MFSPVVSSVLPLSDSFFHQKIMNKYRKGIGKFFSFPLMIFSRSTMTQKIRMDISMRSSFHKQNTIFHIISEHAEHFKNMFSWFVNEKFLPLCTFTSTLLNSTHNLYKTVKLIQPELISSIFPAINNSTGIKTNVFRSGLAEVKNTEFAIPVVYSSGNQVVDSFNPMQVFYRRTNFSWMIADFSPEKSPGSLLLSQNVTYPQSIDNGIQQGGRILNNSFLNYGNYTIIKPEIFSSDNKFSWENGTNTFHANKNESIWQFQSNFQPASPFTFIQSPVLINKRTFEIRNDTLYNTSQNWTGLYKLPIRNINYNLEAGTVKSLISRRNTYSAVDKENLIFQNQQHIEQKIDQIKKIVGDTKKSIEKSISDNFSGGKDNQQHININNLSDQVYHTIERRIRIERERKGI